MKKLTAILLALALLAGIQACTAENTTSEEWLELVNEMFADPMEQTREQYGIPSRYDLREEGIVTPVKLQ